MAQLLAEIDDNTGQRRLKPSLRLPTRCRASSSLSHLVDDTGYQVHFHFAINPYWIAAASFRKRKQPCPFPLSVETSPFHKGIDKMTLHESKHQPTTAAIHACGLLHKRACLIYWKFSQDVARVPLLGVIVKYTPRDASRVSFRQDVP